MQVTLDIKSDKAPFIIETLKSIKGVKITSITEDKTIYLEEFADAYKQTELAEQGQITLKTFEELLNEL